MFPLREWPAGLRHYARSVKCFVCRTAGKLPGKGQAGVRFVDYDPRRKSESPPGYGDPVILKAVEKATRDVISGAKAYERDSVTFEKPEIYWPVWGCLQSAMRPREAARILDFGGSLGSTFYQILPFIGNADLDWRIVEQPSFTARGRQITEDPRLSFFDDIDSALKDFKPDLIYAGSSIQYLEDPLRAVREFASSEARVVFIDKTPVSLSESYQLIQEVQPSIYQSSYIMTVLKQSDLLGIFEKDWEKLVFQGVKAGPSKSISGKRFQWVQAVFVRKVR